MNFHAQEELKEGKNVIRKTGEKRETFEEKIPDLDPEKMVLTGCGSSYKVSLIVAAEMRALGLFAEAIEASEIIFSNRNIDEETLVIGFSQSGETSETVKALERSSDKGAHTLAVLNTEDSTMDELADISLFTPAGEEKAVLATKSVDSALRTGLIIKDILVGEETDPVDLGNSLEKDISQVVEFIEDSDKAYCLGIGSFKGLAGEAATKLGEGPLIHANYMTSLEFSHGPKSHAKDLPIIILAMQDELEDTYREFLSELEDSDARTAVISPESVDYSDEADLDLNIEEGIFPTLRIIQRLAVEASISKGLDPDNPPNLSKHVEKENL